jgi:hypothetical protein
MKQDCQILNGELPRLIKFKKFVKIIEIFKNKDERKPNESFIFADGTGEFHRVNLR